MFCGFDIETSRLVESAYMYIWQFQINDYTIIGRTWEEFSDLINQFGKFDYRFIVWIANCGHEFQFMRKRFPITELFAKETRQPLKFTINNVEFHEALSISGGNLEQLAKDYAKTQKLVGDLDYSILRNSKTKLDPETELKYCCNDVIILAEFSKFIWEKYIDRGFIPITKTGILRREVKQSARDWCRDHRVKIQSIYNAIRDMFPKSSSQYNFEMEFLFRGGFTHANNRYIGYTLDWRDKQSGGLGVDFTSAYPFTMFNRYVPVSPFYPSEFSQYNLDHFCCKFIVTFENIRSTTSHSIESRNKCIKYVNCLWDNGRLMSGDLVQVYINELDFQTYKQFYKWDKMSIHSFEIARRGYLPKYLLDVLYKHYKRKNDLKKAGRSGSPEYAIAKSGVNSMFGLTCTRLTFNDVIYDDDLDQWGFEPTNKTYDEMISREILSPYFGIWITSQSRRNELKTLFDMTDEYHDVIYSDTDSHKLTDDFFRPYIETYNKMIVLENAKTCYRLGYDMSILWDIGTFDYESDGTIDRFCTLGAKRYIYEEHGKIKQTISGLGKNAIKNYSERLGIDPFDLFKNGMYIPPEYTGKLRACYGGDLPCDDIIDGENMREESSVALVPVEFTLTVNPEWLSLLIQLQEKTKRRLSNEN